MSYEISKNSKRCFATGRELGAGDVFVSVLVDSPKGLERRDFAGEAWPGPPEDAIGFWRGTIPRSDAPKAKPMSAASMFELFERMEKTESIQGKRLFYVLALLLVRKRALKLLRIERQGETETLIVQASHGGDEIRVVDPRLTEEEMEQVETELALVMESGAG